MTTPKERLERTLRSLCNEASRGMRCWCAVKALCEHQRQLPPALWETWHSACLEGAVLSLSRLVVVKEKESVNLQYLLNQIKARPSLARRGRGGNLPELVEKARALLARHERLIQTLEEQRDRTLAHLDRKHVNDPGWWEARPSLDWEAMEGLFKELTGILSAFHQFFLGSAPEPQDWEAVFREEMKRLVSFSEADMD